VDSLVVDTTTAGVESDPDLTLTGILLRRRRPAWPLVIMRIMYGFVLLAWTLTMALDVDGLLGSDALVPSRFATQGRWRYFDLETTGAVWIALIVLVAAAIAIIVGWRPTEWFILTFLVLVAVQRRNPVILNSGDLVLRNFALLLAMSPTGAALSVDRWRRYGRAALRTSPKVAPWGLRLLQLQVMVIYFFAFWSKSGDLWRDGTAVSTVFRIGDLARFDSPEWLVSNVIIIALFTWGALAIELSLSMLLWVKRLRPFLIVLGISLHVFIDVFIIVGFFGPLMVTGLMAFTDAERIDRLVQRRWSSGSTVPV
jgi:hypothetical protein